jgi:hypothetical protein
MAFDPTKPAVDSPLDAAEVCNQLNALKALIDAQQAAIDDLQLQAGDMLASITALQATVSALQGNNP